VAVAHPRAVPRIAAEILQRLVPHPFDQPDHIVQGRVIVAVLGRGSQSSPQPLVALEIRGARTADFVQRGLALLVHHFPNRRQAIHGVGKGDAAAGKDVVLGACGHVAAAFDAAVEEARSQRRLAPTDLGLHFPHLPMVTLFHPLADVRGDGLGELVEVLQPADRRGDVAPLPLPLVAFAVGQRCFDGLQVPTVGAGVVVHLAGDRQFVAAHRHKVERVLAGYAQFHQGRWNRPIAPNHGEAGATFQTRQAEIEECLVDLRVPADPDQRFGQDEVGRPLDEPPAQAVGLVVSVGRRAAHAQALGQVMFGPPEAVVVHLQHEVLDQAERPGVVDAAGGPIRFVERPQELVDPVRRAGIAVAFDMDRLMDEPNQLQGFAKRPGWLHGDLAGDPRHLVQLRSPRRRGVTCGFGRQKLGVTTNPIGQPGQRIFGRREKR